MKKRLIALILAMVMLAALGGCGGSEEKEAAAEEEAAEQTEEAAEEAEQTPSATPAPTFNWKPDGPLTILVPYENGNINDTSIRVLAQFLEKYIGQVVYLENVTGESPADGWAELDRRDGDGLTLGVIDLPTFNNTIIQGLRPYGTDSFTVICNHVTEADVVVVRKNDNRFRSLDDLVEYGLAHQGELVAATSGEKGANHIAVQALAKSAQFTYGVNHQDGVANELQALRDEAADFCVVTAADIAERDTDLRVLGVFSDERIEAYPEVPTLGELGYYDGALGVYRCIVAPGDISDDVRAFYEDAFRQAMEDPEYADASSGITTDYMDSAQTVALVRHQQAFARSLNDAFWTIEVPVTEEEAPAEG